MCITLHRQNAYVQRATRVATRAAGAKVRRTVRSSRRRTVHLNAGRAGASVLISENVAIFFARVVVPVPNKATVLLVRISSTTACARRNVRLCKSKSRHTFTYIFTT